MSNKVFNRLLAVVLAICMIVTAAHLIYAIEAYQKCSIIYFIGKEMW